VKVTIIGAGRMGRGFATADAEVVILTVPWDAIEDTLRQLGELDRTVVVDVSFPYRKRQREASHVHARHLTAPEVDGVAASVLIAGDDPQAKQTVFALADDMGFHPVDVGPLRATRELERLAGSMLSVRLGPLRVLSPP
jgi:predicted dinucleotide-binding enzyme